MNPFGEQSVLYINDNRKESLMNRKMQDNLKYFYIITCHKTTMQSLAWKFSMIVNTNKKIFLHDFLRIIISK